LRSSGRNKGFNKKHHPEKQKKGGTIFTPAGRIFYPSIPGQEAVRNGGGNCRNIHSIDARKTADFYTLRTRSFSPLDNLFRDVPGRGKFFIMAGAGAGKKRVLA